ncbi:hypothetical protein PF005_g20467 [Phytophthora fragariae]|uniref:Uncharacterized protein n=2 Tax=Phytophthora TaxID=4783 RepID=A0A6A3ED16_9STRA|nr:hypothetical protein PF003_g7042 [Phytophthora fragariae]KAE9004097.1 hypothetical protein PR001_g17803 [Phytophthora rubi]KAE8928038.1 hypothetical protein PF009_g21807 [Phytophthora fragariae]KAE8977572.1 hypothetical protein PF011_g23598 [Phytophthora fragariae]KAE9008378.1 hypothetical protein PR002_g15922 [Phytophthora rubi]
MVPTVIVFCTTIFWGTTSTALIRHGPHDVRTPSPLPSHVYMEPHWCPFVTSCGLDKYV